MDFSVCALVSSSKNAKLAGKSLFAPDCFSLSIFFYAGQLCIGLGVSVNLFEMHRYIYVHSFYYRYRANMGM